LEIADAESLYNNQHVDRRGIMMMNLICPSCGVSLGEGPVEADGVECWPCMFKTMDALTWDLLDTLMMNTHNEEEAWRNA
jgi:hypothetical protein